ncbi:MAG: hypothetical protein HY784_01225, partial [Chloroflexi bacterium]|nr:hypothetical protein [Chloroflexota bacterium]
MPGKLSLVLGGASPAAFDFLRRVQPPVIKVVNDFSFVNEIKAISPGTRIIGRLSTGAGPQPAPGDGDPGQRAREFFESGQETYRNNPRVDYWEGWHEPEVETPEQMDWYAAFEAERTALLAGIGLKACLGNFATASPEELQVWTHFTPALKEGKKHGAIIGLHEYSAPRMDSFFGKNQLNPAEDEGDTGWTTCRYRKIYRDYLIPARLHLPLVITETGIDGRVLTGRRPPPGADGAPRRGGWR